MDKSISYTSTRWGVPILLAVAIFLAVAYFATVDAPGGTPITNIVDDTMQYLGRTVSVQGEVDDIVSPHAMVVDQEKSVIGDKVLVLSQDPLEPIGGGGTETLFDRGNAVETTGEVRTFHRQELEQELGITLDESTYRIWEGKPVIVAVRVLKIED